MLKHERFQVIMDYLLKNGFKSNEEMSKDLNIPVTTLRRDLTELEKENKITRFHGGAKIIYANHNNEAHLDDKLKENIAIKKIIAEKALACIKPYETIYIDSGSTTYYLASLITTDLQVRVYTNSIKNAQALLQNGVNDVYMLPGKIKVTTGAIVGVETIKALEKYHFDLCFVGANAYDKELNYYTTDDEEAEVKKSAINSSEFTFMLADSTKANSKAFVKFATRKGIALIGEE